MMMMKSVLLLVSLKIIFNVIFQFVREPRRESQLTKGASGNCKTHRLNNNISKTVKCKMCSVGAVHKTGNKYTALNDKLKYPRAYLQ